MPVVVGPTAINGDADLDPVLGEKLAEPLIKQDAVRVDPQVKMAYRLQRRPEFRNDPPQPGAAGQQGLPAVQDNLHGAESAGIRVLSDALRGPRDHLIGDGHGTAAPALIRSFVDITMITGEITPAMHLYDELA
jgi:hypothetical protein